MNVRIASHLRELQALNLSPGPAKAKRILFLSMDYLGWSTYARQIARYTADRDDIDAVHVYLKLPKLLRLLNHNWRMLGGRRLWGDRDWAWSVLVRHVLRRLDSVAFDLVHCSPGIPALPLARTGKAFSVSTDATMLSCMDLGHPQPDPNELENERRVFRAARVVVAWSSWAARSLKDQCQYGVPADRVLVAPPASIVSAGKVEPRRNLRRILFVGNDWKRKGGPLLLQWHQQRWADRCELWIVSSQAVMDPESRNVRWLGAVPNDKLIAEIFPAADLFVFPTQSDMTPVVLAEAIAAGLPCVTSRIAGIPDLVDEGYTGFLLPPDDHAGFIAAVERLMEDSQLLQAFSSAALERARTCLNGPTQFNHLLDALVRVASTPRSPT